MVTNNQEKLVARIVRLKELAVGDHRAARRFIASNYRLPEAWDWPEERVRRFLTDERLHLEALRT